jgi:hypothetical protein
MLFKFTAPDMLNTSLVDVATGERAYNIVTVLSAPTAPSEDVVHPSSPLGASSSERSLSTNSSATFLKKSAPAPNPVDLKGEQRQTTVTDAAGKVVANITWTGRRPNITIGDENIGPLTDLFGSSTVRFMYVFQYAFLGRPKY